MKKVISIAVLLAAGAAIYSYVTIGTGTVRQELNAHAKTLSDLSDSLEAADRSLPDLVNDSAARLEKLRAFREALARLEANLDAQTFEKVRAAHALAELVVSTSLELLRSSKLSFQAYRSALELLTENHRTLSALLVGDAPSAADRGKTTDALQRIDTLLETGDRVTEVLGTHLLELEIRWVELSKEAENLKNSSSSTEDSRQLAGTIERYLGIGGTSLEQARKTHGSGEGLSKRLRDALAKQKALEGVVK